MTTDPHAIQPGAHGAHGHAPEPLPFTPAEVADFQKSDRGAGAVVIMLMAGIFLTGVVLYTTIAIITYR